MSNFPYLDVGAQLNIDCRLTAVANAGEVGCALFGPDVDLPLVAESDVVVDIGMNVGLASLYFANLPQVKEVHRLNRSKGHTSERLPISY